MEFSSSNSYPENRDATKDPLSKSRSLRFITRIENTLPRFSPSERLVLYIFTIIMTISTLVFLAGVNAGASVVVPTSGGSFKEGVVGSARFINPLLAISESDKDLTQLVYSGLTRVMPDGSIIPDLASSYQISEDGLTYTFILREGLTFHDGEPLTSEDVSFTVESARNPDIRSSRRADWEGVTVATPDERTIVFTLPKAYAPFLENTTMGILPGHLWYDVSPAEFAFSRINIQPVGSGPYAIAKVIEDATGVPTGYELKPFKQFALGKPYIENIDIAFFPNEDALLAAWKNGEVDSFAGVSPSSLSSIEGTANIVETPLPRVFGVFFNQGHSTVLANEDVRKALDAAIDKQALVDSVLRGYAVPIDSPIPPGILNPFALPSLNNTGAFDGAERARKILTAAGWKFNETERVWEKGKEKLTFALATADSPELTATAQALSSMWQDAGINPDIHVYPISELNTNVIRPRSYDAILFGEVVGRTLDLFAFWHSSQRNDPGLNLAMYTNSKTDALLADARTTTNEKDREKLYSSFVEILQDEMPASFLFAPELVYVFPEYIQGARFGVLVNASERFLNVHEWYTETERVWNVFTNHSE